MHVSVDIETLGSADNAQVIQISAVAFELGGAVLEPHELLQAEDRRFDAYPRGTFNTSIDPVTEAWWREPEQAEAALRIATATKEEPEVVLDRFSKFVRTWVGKRGKIWALPPQFDFRILRGTYGLCRMPVPWHYSQEHDLRTLLWAATKAVPSTFRAPRTEGRGLVKHFALHDAARQAMLAQSAFRALKLSVDQ